MVIFTLYHGKSPLNHHLAEFFLAGDFAPVTFWSQERHRNLSERVTLKDTKKFQKKVRKNYHEDSDVQSCHVTRWFLTLHTFDERKPAPDEVGTLSHDLQAFRTIQGGDRRISDFWTINSTSQSPKMIRGGGNPKDPVLNGCLLISNHFPSKGLESLSNFSRTHNKNDTLVA